MLTRGWQNGPWRPMAAVREGGTAGEEGPLLLTEFLHARQGFSALRLAPNVGIRRKDRLWFRSVCAALRTGCTAGPARNDQGAAVQAQAQCAAPLPPPPVSMATTSLRPSPFALCPLLPTALTDSSLSLSRRASLYPSERAGWKLREPTGSESRWAGPASSWQDRSQSENELSGAGPARKPIGADVGRQGGARPGGGQRRERGGAGRGREVNKMAAACALRRRRRRG